MGAAAEPGPFQEQIAFTIFGNETSKVRLYSWSKNYMYLHATIDTGKDLSAVSIILLFPLLIPLFTYFFFTLIERRARIHSDLTLQSTVLHGTSMELGYTTPMWSFPKLFVLISFHF